MVHEGAIVKSRIDTHARHCSRPVASDPNDTLNCEEPDFALREPEAYAECFCCAHLTCGDT